MQRLLCILWFTRVANQLNYKLSKLSHECASFVFLYCMTPLMNYNVRFRPDICMSSKLLYCAQWFKNGDQCEYDFFN